MLINMLLVALAALVHWPRTSARALPGSERGYLDAAGHDDLTHVLENIGLLSGETHAKAAIPLQDNTADPQTIGATNLTFSQECDASRPNHATCLQRRELLAGRALQSISDAEFERLRCKGYRLVYCMSVDKTTAATYMPAGASVDSPWKNPTSLQAWGWNIDTQASWAWDIGYKHKDLDGILPQYGLLPLNPDQEKTWKFYPWVHNTQTQHGTPPVQYAATNAEMKNVVNIAAGVIMRDNNVSPRTRLAAGIGDSGRVPDLQHMSDILALTWRKELSARGKSYVSLRYVIAHKVTNPKTLAILVRGAAENKRPVPNERFDHEGCAPFTYAARMGWRTDTPIGMALVASPNGVGQAIMLIQHKDLFGKTSQIQYIEFFCTGNQPATWALHMVFHLRATLP